MSRAYTGGLCVGHFRAKYSPAELATKPRPTCKMEGCASRQRHLDLCARHYQIVRRAEMRNKNQECIVQPCEGINYREGHCKGHYLERFPKAETSIPDCRRPKCTRPMVRFLGCDLHWRNYQPRPKTGEKTADSCSEPECVNKKFSMDRCQLHYNQWKGSASQADDFWQFVKQELKLEDAK